MKKVKKKNTIIANNWIIPKKILLFYLFILIILIGQFAHISLFSKVNGDDLKEIAASRTTVFKELIADRGNIYDNDGNILATNVASYKLIAYLSESRTDNKNNPKHVVDKKMTAQKLSQVLNAPYDYIYKRLEENKYQVEFGNYGKGLTELEKIEIEKLELPGIDFVESTRRFYPNGEFASYIVGYAKEYIRINLKLKENYSLKEHFRSYYQKYDDINLVIYNDKIVADNGDTIKAIKEGSTFFELTVGKDNLLLVKGLLTVTKNDVSVRTDEVIEGELGIESKFNTNLKGINGSIVYQRDLTGYKIPDTPEEKIEAVDGKDIYLTIDSNVQRFLEAAVKKQIKDWDSEWIIMAVMDAKTGEILGSATSPNFDPNRLTSDMSYQNPLVSYAYEPGSVMKIYTYLCAANTGKYDGSKTYKSGSIKIGNTTISEWNKHGWGNISYDIGFTYSSNVGSINIARDYLTPSKLKSCLKSYGFNAKTGIELSGELTGNVNYRENIELDYLSVSFGQGLTTTAIQHLQALSIIANDGHMVKPHIIKKIVDNNTGEVINSKTEVSTKLASTDAVNHVKKLMYDNVHLKTATGYPYYIEDYDIIGKTGTAQIAENGKYLTGDSNYIISFAGMFPYEDPEIIIYTAIKKPKTYQSMAIAPYVKEVIYNISKYRNMYSEIENKKITVNEFTIPSYISKKTLDVKDTLDKFGLKTIIIGDGDKVINQVPIEGTKLLTGDRIFIKTNSKNILMPDMIGWSRNEVVRFANLVGLKYKIDGYGFVKVQNIQAGTILSGQSLEVTLENSNEKKE